MRHTSEQLLNLLPNKWNSRRAADHYDFIEFVWVQTRVLQGLPTRLQGSFDDAFYQLIEFRLVMVRLYWSDSMMVLLLAAAHRSSFALLNAFPFAGIRSGGRGGRPKSPNTKPI